MAVMGPGDAALPVSLVVGDREWPIGALRVPFTVKQVDRLTVDVSVRDDVSLLPDLVALLRATADHIEQTGGT